MKENVWKRAARLLKQYKRQRRWRKIVRLLACVVVFCTTYAMILPAITMENAVYCGKEEHQHEASCYSPKLICELPDKAATSGHIHNEECYSQEQKLICGQEESEEHTHTEDCFTTEKIPICGQEKQSEETIEPHIHTEECYEQVLNCPIEEHSHTADCCINPDLDALSEENEPHPQTMTVEGEDYGVTVTYTEEAQIPESAKLKVNEYSTDSPEYQLRFQEANAVLLSQDGSCIRQARFFDISIMDGSQKIEPNDMVQVEITQSSEITEASDDLLITHATDAGTELIPEVELKQEEDGNVTASFETASFSDFGTIAAAQSVTIGVGDTVELNGGGSKDHSWSVKTEGCVDIEADGSSAKITGKAEGMVEITHTYKEKKKEITESFTVIVENRADADGDVDKEAQGQGYIVTVRGNKKILSDDVTLQVEDYGELQSDYQNYYDAWIADLQKKTSSTISKENFDFLKMYHIYLTKEGQEGEYIPEENVNIQVTITYDRAPENWEKVNWVGHYKMTGGQVNGMEISDGSSYETGIKQIRVSGNSISFHITNFSIFPVAALASDSSGETIGGGTTGCEAAPADGSILTQEQLSWIGKDGSNEWQIVDQKYDGNAGNNKINSTDEKVRVQKNVIPTDVENEFLVYLSIDTKQLFSDFFATATYKATTSNNYHDENLGTIVEAMTGNKSVQVSGNSIYENNANFTILSSKGELLADNITLYWSQANNVTIYLELDDAGTKKYVLTGLSVKVGEKEVVMLSEEAERLIMSNIAQMAQLDKVTDQMGDYIEFVSIESGNYDSQTAYDSNTATLTWVPILKANPEIDKVKTDESRTVTWTGHDGTVRTETVYKYTSWALNVSELVYKVRLDVTKEGFCSAADNMNSNISEKESYKVNESAVLEYGDSASGTIDFPVPYVQGLLYDIQLQKVDEDNPQNKLSGAQFQITSSSGDVYQLKETETKGIYRIENLPWGTYKLQETKPPSGYTKSDQEEATWTIELCYTKNKNNIEQDTSKPQNMLYIGRNKDGVWQIKNKKAPIVDLIKTDMSYNVLHGAKFSIYVLDTTAIQDTEFSADNSIPKNAIPIPGYPEELTVGDDGMIVDNLVLEDGKTYCIVEKKAPDGYEILSKKVLLTVDTGNTKCPISVSGGDGTAQVTSETQNIGNETQTVYVVKIPNNPGVTLPATGGTGTLPYTLGGLGCILAACLMYGYTMWRKRKRGHMNKPLYPGKYKRCRKFRICTRCRVMYLK